MEHPRLFQQFSGDYYQQGWGEYTNPEYEYEYEYFA